MPSSAALPVAVVGALFVCSVANPTSYDTADNNENAAPRVREHRFDNAVRQRQYLEYPGNLVMKAELVDMNQDDSDNIAPSYLEDNANMAGRDGLDYDVPPSFQEIP